MAEPILEIRNLDVTFNVSRGMLAPKMQFKALKDVSLSVQEGEVLAIVGESGSGKTTMAMAALNLNQPSNGEILFRGKSIRSLGRRAYSRHVQPVFQDPYSSLNPRRTIADTIAQPLVIHGEGDAADRQRRVRELMDLVGLPQMFADRLPHELSGGQRQRVSIARALIMRPDILLCDEPTSALDVSVQAQILNLLQDLRRELNLTFILITHNLAIVEYLADRVAVMYLGEIVEQADVGDLFAGPRHPYTRALLDSVLTPDPSLGLPEIKSDAGPASLTRPAQGCVFRPRCAYARESCASVSPEYTDLGGHFVRCHMYDPRFEAEFATGSSVSNHEEVS